MTEHHEKIEHVLDRLRTERDELRVRAHLARAEAREEWDKLEHKWGDLESRAAAAGKEAKEASGDVRSAFDTLAAEIAEAYRRIRRQLH
ncbi:MAG: hypothetical protein OEU49_00250 [Chromatiales bacterium]|jgi:predicted  nucleic acid-binding Zn-ribbon protein|nr:hypothetical protein [Chromatiales bacterium]MDH4029252.1 hypothetical protein [Chromatiales bacterium]